MFRIELKRNRESMNLTQEKLAEIIGVSQSAVGLWESGKREPNISTLCKLADFFGITVDSLIDHNCTKNNDVPVLTKLTENEEDLLVKYRAIGNSARSRIMNALNFEYEAIHQENAKSSNLA